MTPPKPDTATATNRRAWAKRRLLHGWSLARIAQQAGVTRAYVQQLLSPPTWLKARVAEQAQHRCQACGLELPVERDVPQGDLHDETATDWVDDYASDHLTYLCATCHRRAHLGLREQLPCWPDTLALLQELTEATGHPPAAILHAALVELQRAWTTAGKL